MRTYIYITIGSLLIFTFLGGTNFLGSFFLDLENYSIFSEIHMTSLYLSAIFALAIGYCAPRIVTMESTRESPTDLIYSLALYSTLLFLFISVCLIEVLQLHINEGRLKIYTILCLSLYFSFCQNIYGILLATKRYLDSMIYLLITVSLYIVIVFISSASGNINVIAWLLGTFCCLIGAFIFSITIKKGFSLVSLNTIAIFANSNVALNLLLPSVIAGLVNGVALLILYSTFVESSNPIQVAFLGYIFVLKSASQFFTNIANKIIFINLSHKFSIGEFALTKAYFSKILIRNILGMILAIAFLWASYLVFYNYYFEKYVEVPVISYFFLFSWILLEIFYFVIYQSIQVNGLMWKSLFIISIPSLLYASIISVFIKPMDTSEMLVIYCCLTLVSIAGAVYLIIRNKSLKERNNYVQ